MVLWGLGFRGFGVLGLWVLGLWGLGFCGASGSGVFGGCSCLGLSVQASVAIRPGEHNAPYIVNPRKLEHGFRMINAGIPYTLP